MTKNDKFIIIYSIMLGFFFTILLLYALAVLLAPGYVVDFTLSNPWRIILCGSVGILSCVYGIYRRIKNHKTNKDEASFKAGRREVAEFANQFAGIKHNPEWKARLKDWEIEIE